MANRLGSANICITQLRDGFSSAVVTLYRESASTEKPLRLLYTFSSGELASGVDGKTLSECLNGWSTERSATTHYAISASVRSDGEIGSIETTSWSDSYLVAEKGETIVSVTLYQRAIESPERPTTAITYNFYTGAVTGGLGAWSASIPEWGTAPLWSISAVASAVLNEGVESDEISASEWSAPKKVAENGESPVEIYFSTYSWLFPADSDGLVSAEEYAKFQVDVNAVKGNSAVEVALSCELTGITNITVSGNSIVGSEKSVMLGDSASVKVSVVVEGVTYSRVITLAKAKQSKSATLYFAWSKSENIFTPKDSNFWIMGTSFIFFNNSLMGNIPFTSSWVDNWEEIQSAKTDEYCYLWCKTSEDGTPFLFTGATGKTGEYRKVMYALSESKTTIPTDGWTETMPDIVNSTQYLWYKEKIVPAGGNADEVEWSDAVVSAVGIAVTESKISLSADGSNFVVGNQTILLDAPNIIVPNTITANEIKVEDLFSKSIQIEAGGDIHSKEYTEDSDTGFKIESNGKLTAQGATLDGVKLQKNSTIESDSLSTSNIAGTDTLNWTGTAFADCSEYYWKLSEIIAYLTANSSSVAYQGSENTIYSCSSWQYGTWKSSYSWSKSLMMGAVVQTYKPQQYGYVFDSSAGSVGLCCYCKVTQDYYQEGKITYSDDFYKWATKYTITDVMGSTDLYIEDEIQAGPSYSSWVGSSKYGYLTYASPISTPFSANIINGMYNGTDVTGCKLVNETSSLKITRTGVTYTLSSGYRTESDWVSSYSIDYETEGIGVYVSDLFPKTKEVSRVGSDKQKFGEAYINSVYATNLYGTLNGDSSGTHIGNVNSDSTKNDYQVWGAVFN